METATGNDNQTKADKGPERAPAKPRITTVFASVKLTVVLMSLIAFTVLVGAWCPQESQVGREKVVEQFGPDTAQKLIQFGIADIFHSPWFLSLIGMLTLNMIACSFQRVFPKIRSLKQPMPFLKGKEITKLPVTARVEVLKSGGETLERLSSLLRKKGFKINEKEGSLTAEYGKYGRLAATVTHIGLLTLMAGVTITSWCGFNGFKPVILGDRLTFEQSEHSKLWVGKLPQWYVRVEKTRREDHESGDPKQWYSTLSVFSSDGNLLKTQEISVNNPLSYDGVDIYQSSWGLNHILVTFNNTPRVLELQPMGKIYASFLPLDKESVMLFSVRSGDAPIRIFAKRPDWESPRLLAELTRDKPAQLGAVTIKLEEIVPVSGLQYKCDPGLPITYTAFAFIIIGVMMAAIPHRHLWVSVEEDKQSGNTFLYAGGRSLKAKVGFERLFTGLIQNLKDELLVKDPQPQEKEPTITRARPDFSITADERGFLPKAKPRPELAQREKVDV